MVPKCFTSGCFSQYSSSSSNSSCVRPNANTGSRTFPYFLSVATTLATEATTRNLTHKIFFAVPAAVVRDISVGTFYDHYIGVERWNLGCWKMAVFFARKITSISTEGAQKLLTGHGYCQSQHRTSQLPEHGLLGNM